MQAIVHLKSVLSSETHSTNNEIKADLLKVTGVPNPTELAQFQWFDGKQPGSEANNMKPNPTILLFIWA